MKVMKVNESLFSSISDTEKSAVYVGRQIRITEPYSFLLSNALGEVIAVSSEGDLTVKFPSIYFDPTKINKEGPVRDFRYVSVPIDGAYALLKD